MDQSPVARISLAEKLLVHGGQLPVHGFIGLVVIADVVGPAEVGCCDVVGLADVGCTVPT